MCREAVGVSDDRDLHFALLETLAESISYFYDCLLEEGFESEQALRLCVAYLKSMSRATGSEGDKT